MRVGKAVAIATILLVAGLLLAAGVAVPAEASIDGPVYTKAAVRHATAAHRAAVRAERRADLARYAAHQTRAITARYGKNVGRWVTLALDVGWPRSTLGQLAYIIHRESGGSPGAKNPASTASGLLQMLAFHWDGSGDYGWSFDPFNPRQNLAYGHRLYLKCGWSPWAL
jgi:hypothetical protein